MKFGNLKKFISELKSTTYDDYDVIILTFDGETTVQESSLFFIGADDEKGTFVLVDEATFKKFPDEEE